MLVRHAVDKFRVGSGIATTTPQPISDNTLPVYQGVRIRAGTDNDGAIDVGPLGVSAGNSFQLAPGKDLLVQVNRLNKVFVCSATEGNTYAWAAV